MAAPRGTFRALAQALAALVEHTNYFTLSAIPRATTLASGSAVVAPANLFAGTVTSAPLSPAFCLIRRALVLAASLLRHSNSCGQPRLGGGGEAVWKGKGVLALALSIDYCIGARNMARRVVGE